MAKETKAKAAAETEAKKVVVVNVGVALIFIGSEKLMPGNELEVDVSFLTTSGAEYLFGQEALEVKDDREATHEIRQRVKERQKKDPNAGKSQKEVEDGGEF